MDLRPPSRSARAGWLTLGASGLVGLVLGLLIFRAPAAPTVGAAATTFPAASVDSPAPDFALESVDGETIRLGDLRGKIVALNFWATWCAPCRLEMPDLQRRAERYPEELAVVGVDFDETRQDVAAFRDEVEVAFPLLLDPEAKVQRLYRVLGYPTTFFIDQEGTIRFQHIGLMSAGQLDEYLEKMGLSG